MKILHFAPTGFLILWTFSSFSPSPLVIDLHNLVKNKGIEVFNRKLSIINEESHKGIRLSKDGGEEGLHG